MNKEIEVRSASVVIASNKKSKVGQPPKLLLHRRMMVQHKLIDTSIPVL